MSVFQLTGSSGNAPNSSANDVRFRLFIPLVTLKKYYKFSSTVHNLFVGSAVSKLVEQ